MRTLDWLIVQRQTDEAAPEEAVALATADGRFVLQHAYPQYGPSRGCSGSSIGENGEAMRAPLYSEKSGPLSLLQPSHADNRTVTMDLETSASLAVVRAPRGGPRR